MPRGRSIGGGSSSRGRGGAAFRRVSGGRATGRGRGGRGSGRGRGTALPSAFASKTGDARGGRHGRSRGKGGDAGYEFEDKAGGVSDRHKYDDEAGDSDAGPDPDDSDFEDEEVDEDEAFNSADENRYGDLLETILEKRKGGGSGADEDSDRAEGSGDDDDLDEKGGMSLMDMLNANEAREEGGMADGSVGSSQNMATRHGKSTHKKGAQGGGARAGDEMHTAPASISSGGSEEEFADHDDEDSSGDDAMDDDESKRGEADHDTDGSDDEEVDEEDETERHARLLGFVESLGERTAAADRAAEDRLSSQLLQEGEFNATAAAAAGINNGVSREGAITVETLMRSLQDTKGFAAVKRQVAAFSGKTGTPSAPTSKAAELRAEREAAYESRRSDMGKWVAPVQANRQSETLDFSQSVKTNLSNAAMASKLKPTTDMEREVELLLTAGGALEANVAEREREELQAKAFTVEEVKERQAELSKMRALMFYQERKQHHMNKIKSKVYRKVKKRQRNRAGEAELEASGELEEVKARKRAEERMSLRHKNTTKWVKSALRARGGAGQDDRKAISEQLRLGQELRAKMDSVDKGGDSESDESSSDDGAGNNVEGASKGRKSALRASDRAALLSIGEDGEEIAEDAAVSGKGSALLKMAFMQKAMDKQRKRAKEEASMLLKELESASAAADMEDDGGSSDDAGARNGESSKSRSNPNGKARSNTTASREAQAKAAAEIAQALPSGTLQTKAVSMDPSARSSVSSPITINLGGTNTNEPTNARENGWNGGEGGELSLAEEEGDRRGHERGALPTASLNRKSDEESAAGMAKESESAKRRRDYVYGEGNRSIEQSDSQARRQANGLGDQSDGGQVEGEEMSDRDEEEGGRDNPWLAPTPRRSSDRRRASANVGRKGCDVVLDVRKAAATALSVFSAPSDGHPAAASTGAAPSPGGMIAGERVVTKKRKDQEETAVESGRSKRRRGAGTGGDGAGGGSSNGARGQGEGGGEKSNSSSDVGAHEATEKNSSDSQTESRKNGSESKKRAKKKEKRQSNSSGGLKPRAEVAVPQRKLGGLSNDELVRRAFAAPDFETEFKVSKDDEVDAAVSKGREKLPGDIAGWGSWTGEGARPPPLALKKRRLEAEAIQAKKEEKLKKARKDDRLPRVVINEKRQKRSAKYMVSEVPYPFTSRQQYERSLRQPIGGEWNTSQSVQALTKPAVIVRPGAVVKPMKLGKLDRESAKEKQAVYAAGKSVGGKGARRAVRGGKAKVGSSGGTGRNR